MVDGNDDLRSAIDEFNTWFEERYGAGLKVKVAPIAGKRLGVVATQSIRLEEAYLSVPLSIVIDAHSARRDPTLGPTLRHLPPALSTDEIILSLFLVYETFVRGNQSDHAAYLRLLPQNFPTPLHSSEEDLAWWTGTMVGMRARGIQSARRGKIIELRKHWLPRAPPALADAFTVPRWEWAMDVLSTRMIWWDGAAHVVPMLDAINCLAHSPRHPHPMRPHRTIRIGSKAVTHSAAGFERGEEVVENYAQPNPTYALFHGFALVNNPNDCATIEWVPSEGERAAAAGRRSEYCVREGNYDALERWALSAYENNATRAYGAMLRVLRHHLGRFPPDVRRRRCTIPTDDTETLRGVARMVVQQQLCILGKVIGSIKRALKPKIAHEDL